MNMIILFLTSTPLGAANKGRFGARKRENYRNDVGN